MERLRSRREEWGEEVGRSGARRWEGVGFLRGGTSPNPDLLPANVECLLGAGWRDGLDPTDTPPIASRFLPRGGVGGKQMERPGRY